MPPAVNGLPLVRQVPSLSALLQENVGLQLPTKILQTNDGHWNIVTVGHRVETEPCPFTTEVHWDVERGAIVEQLWYQDVPNAKRFMNFHAKTTLQKVGRDWVPAEVFLVAHGLNNAVYRWTFEDVVVNRTLADSDFLVEFPPDIHLTDYTTGKHYLTGSNAVDERMATEEFIRRTGLRPPVPAPTGSGWRNWIGGLLLLALAAVAFLGFRRWRALSLLFIGLSVCSGTQVAFAQPSSPVQHGSVISHTPLERIAISRCGLRATLFALEYFGCRSNPSAVDQSLTPHWDGIALSEIVDILTAHGLTVDVRKGVTLAQVATAVTPTRMALLPVNMRNGWNHYYLATVDADGHVVIVDPPHGVYPWKQALRPEALAPTGGIVAFVEVGAKPTSTDATRLSATPPQIDLGDMVVELSTVARSKEVQLELKNTGRTPLFVAEVRKSCGCTEPSWRGGLIPAGKARQMTLTVSPPSWGIGRQAKHIRFVMADGSDFVVEVHGRGITNAEAHGIAIPPASLNLVIDDSETDGSADESAEDHEGRVDGKLRVRCLSAKPSDVRFDGNKEWLQFVPSSESAPEGVEGDFVELNVSVNRVQYRSDRSHIPAQIRVWTTANLDPVTVGVAINRPPRLTVEPRSVKLTEDGSGICRIRPTGKRQIEGHGEVVSLPAGIRLESTLGADGVLELRMTLAAPKLATKFFTVEVPVRLSTGESERAHFVVRR